VSPSHTYLGMSGYQEVNPRPIVTRHPSDKGHTIVVRQADDNCIEITRTKSASPAPPAAPYSPDLGATSTQRPLSPNSTVEQAQASGPACERKAEFFEQLQEQLRFQEESYKKGNKNSEANMNAETNGKRPLLVSPKEQLLVCSSPDLVLQKAADTEQNVDIESPLVAVTEGVATLDLSRKNTDQCLYPSPQLPMVDHSSGLEVHIMQWVDATKNASFDSLTPAESQCMSIPSDLHDSIYDTIAEAELPYSTKAIVTEVMYILRNQSYDSDLDELLPGHNDKDYAMPTTDGAESPKSGTTSASAQTGTSSAQSGPSSAMPLLPYKSSDRDEDGEPPAKRFGGGLGPSINDTPPKATLKSQMPCPMSDLLGCMGTNPTISEMLRSLQNRHRIVICTDRYSKLEVPEKERKAENVLKRHTSTGCERRCIGQGCLGMDQATSTHHRRTEKCPNWKALSKEIRWPFIWVLLNPGLEPPFPEFVSAIGYEHSSVLTPCKEKSRERGLELCRTVMADIDAKTERLQSLEHELETSNQQKFQLQQRCDDKIANLENIIETLVECLKDRNVDIPLSLQKRLSRECPGCIIPSTPSQPQMPPTPESTSEKMLSIAQLENGKTVGRSTWISSSFDPSAEAFIQQAAAQLQPADVDISMSTTQTNATQNATSRAIPDGMNFEDFLHAPMDTSAGDEMRNLTWPTY
jgi:hypothetical protein